MVLQRIHISATDVRRFATALAVAVMLALTALFGTAAIAADPAGKCGYYRNSAGQEVPRPCGNWRNDPTPPAGATAECRVGTGRWSLSIEQGDELDSDRP